MGSIALRIWRACTIFSLVLLTSHVPLQSALADHDEAKKKIQAIADQWKNDLANGQNSASWLFQQHLRPIIFLNGIAYVVTRPHWNAASAAEKTEFLSIFAKKIERDVTCDIQRNRNLESIVVGEAEELTGGYSVVYTKIQRTGRRPASLNWKFIKDKERALRLFDVIYEGASLVQTYRDEYRSILRSTGLSGLTEDLAENVANKQDCPPPG